MAGSRPKGGLRQPPKPPKVDAVRNEINVTPLVDVCLVLLIIFMVVLPLMERGKNIPLPTTSHHEDAEDTQQPIVVIERVGTLYVYGPGATNEEAARVPGNDIAAMQKRVQREWKALTRLNDRLGRDGEERKGEDRVLIKAHPDALYNKVYPVILALHDIGANGIDLGTEEKKE